MRNPISPQKLAFGVFVLGILTIFPGYGQASDPGKNFENEEITSKVKDSETGSRRVNKRYSKLIHDATEAIRQNPGEATLYLARGWAFFELNKTDEQIADATMAINLKTKNGKAFFLRADGYLRQGRYQNALGDLTRAFFLGEADTETSQHRALVFYYLGRFKEAVDLNSKILDLNPTAEIPRIDRGLAHFCMGNYTEALRDFGKVFEGAGSSSVVREFARLRGMVLSLERGNPMAKKALLEMVKVLRDSKKPAPGFHYGQCRSLAI